MSEIQYIDYNQRYLEDLIDLWNDELIFDPISKKRFLQVIIYDENFDKSLALLALKDEEVVGFIYGVKRKTSYYTRGLEPDRAWVNYIFVKKQYQNQGIGQNLYRLLESKLASLGTKEITLSAYSPNYLNPGVDIRYEKGINFFNKNGYKLETSAVSMHRSLLDNVMSEKTKTRIATLEKEGIKFFNYKDEYFSKLMTFLEKEFPGGWERNFISALQNNNANDTIILCTDKNDDILGYCMRKIDGNDGRFGPIGVAASQRSKGLGGVLFDIMMLEMQKQGIACTYFLWTSGAAIKFYERHGMKVYREYKVGKKEI